MFAFKTIGNNLDLPRDKYLRDRNASVRRGGAGGQTCERCSKVIHNTQDNTSKLQVVHSPFRKFQLCCLSVKALQKSIPIPGVLMHIYNRVLMNP